MLDEPLLSPTQKDYVILFPNPFDNSLEHLDKALSLKTARNQFFKFFKKSYEYQKLNSQQDPFLTQIKSKVFWLASDQPDKEKIPEREFLKSAISAILFTIRSLGLSYNLTYSRDRDEIFCEIFASEDWLKGQAKQRDYKLQLRGEKEKKFKFKSIQPYAKLNINNEVSDPDVNFKHYDSQENETSEGGSLFLYSDRVRLIKSCLYNKLDLSLLKQEKITINDFCLHTNSVEVLNRDWASLAKVFSKQPLNKIRNYFGEEIAFYFSWMEMFKKFMVFAGGFGLVFQSLLLLGYLEVIDSRIGKISQAGFAFFLAVWAMTFDKIWHRKEKVYSWKWGTTGFTKEEEQRGEFKGEMERDLATGKFKRIERSRGLSYVRKFISFSVVILLISISLSVIWGVIFTRWLLKTTIQNSGLIIAGILNSIQIKIMNLVFDKIVIMLNNWENHETQSEYMSNLAIKIFLVRFFNSYSSLFYIAYHCEDHEYNHDSCMDMLSVQLAVIVSFNFLMNIVEIFVPYYLMKIKILKEDLKIKEMMKVQEGIRAHMLHAEYEAKKEDYDNPLSDYIEMIIEFGYVALFGTALPALPLFLLIEIMFEIKVDAWKICNLYKRSFPERSEDIGVFRKIILVIAYAGAVNNAGLIVFTSGIMESFYGIDCLFSDYFHRDTGYKCFVAFGMLEHGLLLAMFFISILIPDIPEVVKKGLIWGERIIQERLYKVNQALVYSIGKRLVLPNLKLERIASEHPFIIKEEELIK